MCEMLTKYLLSEKNSLTQCLCVSVSSRVDWKYPEAPAPRCCAAECVRSVKHSEGPRVSIPFLISTLSSYFKVKLACQRLTRCDFLCFLKVTKKLCPSLH